jgi:hypothetical protein
MPERACIEILEPGEGLQLNGLDTDHPHPGLHDVHHCILVFTLILQHSAIIINYLGADLLPQAVPDVGLKRSRVFQLIPFNHRNSGAGL